MNHRQNSKAYRVVEETTGVARHDVSDWFKQRGEDFWHSVWERIESREPRRARGRRMRNMPPEAPRDYVVNSEART